MDGRLRTNIFVGCEVEVLQRQHQSTGELTWGILKKILTNSQHHPHGIKVMLEDKVVGRVHHIITEE